jgi:hypothetical protein
LLVAGKPLTSAELLPSIYPRWHRERFEGWHFTNLRRAAPRFAYVIARLGKRGKPVWALKADNSSAKDD